MREQNHFFSSLKRHKSKTFKYLYNTTVTNKNNERKTIKADRKLIQKLLNASQAGRKVDMKGILAHELSPVPLSLAKNDASMNSASKSDILHILTKDMNINIPTEITVSQGGNMMKSIVIIDGHALIQSIGKPLKCSTFGEYINRQSSQVYM